MRRGKLSNLSIKLVILIAFFTLTSFVFDQLVIQTENKIRDVDFEYERSFNEYLRTKSVLFNVNDLVYRTRVKNENFIDRAEILEKAIYNIKFNKPYFEKNFNSSFTSDLNQNLQTIFINRYKSMYLEIFEESSYLFRLVRGLPIRAMQENELSEFNQNIVDNIWNLEKVLNSNIEFYETYKFHEKKEIITYDDYVELRSNLRKFLNYYTNSSIYLAEINEIYGKYYNFFAAQSYSHLDELNQNLNLKNFYILLSVLAQILSLFFLLLLFRTLLNLSAKIK
tara:strand:+ start:465 stop:1307 length:843 start_codon:yes stop_codon:yes gene_type:complete